MKITYGGEDRLQSIHTVAEVQLDGIEKPDATEGNQLFECPHCGRVMLVSRMKVSKTHKPTAIIDGVKLLCHDSKIEECFQTKHIFDMETKLMILILSNHFDVRFNKKRNYIQNVSLV